LTFDIVHIGGFMALFGDSRDVPWLLPGFLVFVAIGLVASGRVGRALRIRRTLAAALIVSLGVILAATLTPQWAALAFGARGSGACDLSRMGLAQLRELIRFDDTSLNILLFIPLGLSIAFMPRSRLKVVVIVAAIALPFAIETTQLLLPILDRGCQSADVIDNLTGLLLGLVGGAMAGWLAAAVYRRSR
jgi:glycopeptide antibiotics resistance protein